MWLRFLIPKQMIYLFKRKRYNAQLQNIDAECIKYQKQQHITTKNYNPDPKANPNPRQNIVLVCVHSDNDAAHLTGR